MASILLTPEEADKYRSRELLGPVFAGLGYKGPTTYKKIENLNLELISVGTEENVVAMLKGKEITASYEIIEAIRNSRPGDYDRYNDRYMVDVTEGC
jgi:hypothetical protein